MLRRQLPVLSPLAAGDVLRALARLRPGGSHHVRDELARLLRDRFGADDVALYGSGTQALEAAIRAARRLDGSSERFCVALPAFGCYDLLTAAVGADVEVVFYDLDPDTLSPVVESFDAALSAGAGAAVAAPLYGYPVDWDRLEEVSSGHGVTLIEDAAQAAGARWRGRSVGALGVLSVLSFGRGKGWTGAGGGALLGRGDAGLRVPDPGRGGRVRDDLRVAVEALAQWLLGRPSLYGLPSSLPWLHLGETRYRSPRSLRPIPAASAALALETHGHLETEAAVRRRNARRLLDRLDQESPEAHPVRALSAAEPGYLRLPVRLSPRARSRRDDAWKALGRRGVARSYPKTLPELSAAVRRTGPRTSASTLPGASSLASELVTLPTHSLLTDRDLRRLLDDLT